MSTLTFDIFARDRASGVFSRVGGNVGRLHVGVGKLVTAVAGLAIFSKATDFMKSSIGAASDLNETVNKSNVIFGRSAKEVNRWSQSSATSLGLSRQAALDAASQFGNMFTQLGYTSKASAKVSESTVKMAADLGSFNNLPTADVLDSIQGGLRGEYDSLQRLIPNISAARVQQVAMNMTGKKNVNSLTAQEKAAATLAIIHKDGARAMGDFARTSGGLANQQKILGAQFQNLKAKIGTAVLPIMVKLANFTSSTLMPEISKLWTWVKVNAVPVAISLGKRIASDVVPALKDMASDVVRITGFLRQHQAIVIPLAAALGTMGGTIWIVVKAMKLWAAIVKTATAVQLAWNTTMLGNPIVLVAAALAGLVVGLIVAYKRSKTFRDIVQAIWGKMKDFAGWVKSAFFGIIHGISDAFRAVGDFIKKWIAKLEIWGSDIALALISPFTHLPGRLGAPFRAAYDKVAAFKERAQAKLDALKAGVQTRDFNQKMASVRGQLASLHSRVVDIYVRTSGVTDVLNSLARVRQMASGLSYFGGRVKTNAGGTSFFPGGLSWVGERGPELLSLPRGAEIKTAQRSRGMGASDQPIVIHNHVYLDGKQVEQTQVKLKQRNGKLAYQ